MVTVIPNDMELPGSLGTRFARRGTVGRLRQHSEGLNQSSSLGLRPAVMVAGARVWSVDPLGIVLRRLGSGRKWNA
jgi:hypothetical protein